ncbi:hypothetical protein GCM10009808_07070 [Microbacterium sediminicola]|uniref:Helix-hairpin-helix DNA-binding motif class 1 domain-containing protein n=1 Tax=Microbacterium sediminicola TaxID=415210 RepID=A0ABN2HS19_9MICO
MPADRSERRRWGTGAVVVLVLGALAVTVAIGVIRSASAPVETVVDATTVEIAEPSLYVHVSGAVTAPGLYLLPPGARVVDAVAAAGGFSEDADRAAVNLARSVSDGEQLVVLREGEVAGPQTGTGDGLVNLNTADIAALDTLPGIGPAIAQRIIDWREDNGRFTSVEDLLAVSGIGAKLLAGIRDMVGI